MNSSKLIAVTGGIGSGKSVVSRILRVMGYEVYDCDSRAKRLMDESNRIKRRIAEEVCAEAIVVDASGDMIIDRKRLADAVFSDADKLRQLNGIVHGAVKEDIATWHATASKRQQILFVETAILYTAGMDKMVDGVWMVEAPMHIRLKRAMSRDNASRDAVAARIEKQHGEELLAQSASHRSTSIIINDGMLPLLPQVEALLGKLAGE